jgi:hypothetical protein
MMVATCLPSEAAGIVGVVDPDAYSTGTQTTGWIDMADFEAVMAIVMAGTLGSSATLDAKLEQATDSSGTSAKDVSGKSITQLTKASPDESDQQAVINMRREELDVQNGFTHVRLSLTVGTASSDAAGIVLGFMPRQGPASDQDLSSVAEIVQ